MFVDNGNMKVAKTKSSLKNDLKLEVTVKNAHCNIIGWLCNPVRVVSWPSYVIAQDFFNIFHAVMFLFTYTLLAISRNLPEVIGTKGPVGCILFVLQTDQHHRKLH